MHRVICLHTRYFIKAVSLYEQVRILFDIVFSLLRRSDQNPNKFYKIFKFQVQLHSFLSMSINVCTLLNDFQDIELNSSSILWIWIESFTKSSLHEVYICQ